MQHPDYTSLKMVMEMLANSKKLRRLAWGVLVVAALFAVRLPELITAIR